MPRYSDADTRFSLAVMAITHNDIKLQGVVLYYLEAVNLSL
jgi:hypothetical protein